MYVIYFADVHSSRSMIYNQRSKSAGDAVTGHKPKPRFQTGMFTFFMNKRMNSRNQLFYCPAYFPDIGIISECKVHHQSIVINNAAVIRLPSLWARRRASAWSPLNERW